MTDTVLQRRNMVESQVRPSDVTDRRITAAMTAVPREAFLPEGLAKFAYSDETLTLSSGAAMLAPSILAKLVQLADVGDGDTVLVVGGAAGYAAAIVAKFAKTVVALLPDETSAADVRGACSKLGITNVTAVAGAMANGWASLAPYGAIIIEGGVETVPDALTALLRDGGRLAAIEIERGLGHAFVIHKNGAFLARRDAFQAAAPLLAGFAAPKPAFVF